MTSAGDKEKLIASRCSAHRHTAAAVFQAPARPAGYTAPRSLPHSTSHCPTGEGTLFKLCFRDEEGAAHRGGLHRVSSREGPHRGCLTVTEGSPQEEKTKGTSEWLTCQWFSLEGRVAGAVYFLLGTHLHSPDFPRWVFLSHGAKVKV